MEPVVLFVDDDANILSALIRSFHKQPFQVYTARSAEDAKDVLKRTGIHAIVTDESMPGTNGTELLSWVAKHFPEMPRIILTGQPSFPSMETAINDAGVYKYLTKPIDHTTLAEVVLDALKTKQHGQSVVTKN